MTHASTAGSSARLARRAFAAVVLAVLGLGFVVLYFLGIGGERHSWVAGAAPQGAVELTAGRTYSLGIHGGVAELARRGVQPAALTCSYTPAAGATRQLQVTPLDASTRALDEIATFIAPLTGPARVACDGVGNVYVDNAGNAGADRAGWFLLAGTVALTVGLPLLLSVLRQGGTRVTPAEPPAELVDACPTATR